MIRSTENDNNLEDVFKAQIAEVADGGFWPSSEDGIRLMVTIHIPLRLIG